MESSENYNRTQPTSPEELLQIFQAIEFKIDTLDASQERINDNIAILNQKLDALLLSENS